MRVIQPYFDGCMDARGSEPPSLVEITELTYRWAFEPAHWGSDDEGAVGAREEEKSCHRRKE
jgi:hypothetical protein